MDSVPEDPIELMRAVESNLPVWEFIPFLLYAGVFTLSDKEAMHTANVRELDYARGYTSILARASHKTNYAKCGVLMNLVLHSSHPWCRAIMDKVRTHRSSDLPCTGTGKETAIGHSGRDHKGATVVVSDHRLSAANVAMTAKREVTHMFNSYLGVPARAHSKQMVLDEDVQVLVEQFELCFGTTFDQLNSKSPPWSMFANRGATKGDCGAQKIKQVWAGTPGWVKNMTTSCYDNSGQQVPLIFEPPDVGISV